MYSRILLGVLTCGVIITAQSCSVSAMDKNGSKESSDVQVKQNKNAREGWVSISSKRNKFSVDFPTKPKVESSHEQLPDDKDVKVSTELFISDKDGGPAYFVSVTRYSPPLDMTDPKTHLKGALEGMKRTLQNPRVEMTEFTQFDGNHAIKFMVRGDKKGKEYIFQGMYILVDGNLYQVFVVYNEDQKDEAQFDRFMHSFKLENHS